MIEWLHPSTGFNGFTQPFVEESHAVHMYFLPWWWAVALPTAAVLLLLLCIGNAQTWNEHEIILSLLMQSNIIISRNICWCGHDTRFINESCKITSWVITAVMIHSLSHYFMSYNFLATWNSIDLAQALISSKARQITLTYQSKTMGSDDTWSRLSTHYTEHLNNMCKKAEVNIYEVLWHNRIITSNIRAT